MSKVFFLGLFAIFSLQSAEKSDAKSASAAGAAQLSGADVNTATEEEVKAGPLNFFYEEIQATKNMKPEEKLKSIAEVSLALLMLQKTLIDQSKNSVHENTPKLLLHSIYLISEIDKLNEMK